VNGVISAASALPPPTPIDTSQAVTAAVIAFTLLLIRTVGYTTTVAHEGGHALLGSFFGVPVKGIKFDSPGNAVTTFERAPTGLVDVVTTLAGHLGPSAFGLLAASLLYSGYADAVLWIGLVLLGFFLLSARNLRAMAATVVLGLLVVGALQTHDATTKAVAALTWAWILLAGSVLDVFGLRAYRKNLRNEGRRDDSSDVYQLRKATWIPAGMWVLVFLLGSLTALAYGGALLLSHPLELPGDLSTRIEQARSSSAAH
jgi:hypothetical protein